MDIQRADLGYRRRVIRTLLAVAILLTIVLVGVRFWLGYISARMDTGELLVTLSVLRLASIMLIAICIAALGGHLLLRGNRIVVGRRFPPRDVRAVRDTPVREGIDAVRLGRLSQLGGLACLLLAVLIAAAALLWSATPG